MANLCKPKRLLDEDAVKKMLGIEDFRHLNKKSVVEFISAIPQMEPEVALKALEQFPELTNMALGIAKEYKESVIAAFDANDESSKATIATINAVIEVLSKELEKEELSPEERLHVIDCLSKLAQETREVHKDNQKFLLNGLTILAATVGTVILGAVAVLGANGRIQLPDIEDIVRK